MAFALTKRKVVKYSSFNFYFILRAESHLDLIAGATFCLVLDTHRDSGRVLMDILRHGCIPIVADDSAVLPFAEVLDWKRFSIRYGHYYNVSCSLIF